MPTLRKADRTDAYELARFAEATFRATFDSTNPAEEMDLHCRTNYGESIQAAELSSADIVTLLSEHSGRLVGYAQVCWSGAPDCVAGESPGEIHRLYVDEEWHGKGVAQQLMQASLEEMKARGSDVVWLGVWERNPRAISFYSKFGFVEVGDHVFTLGNDPQRDIVMALSLTPG